MEITEKDRKVHMGRRQATSITRDKVLKKTYQTGCCNEVVRKTMTEGRSLMVLAEKSALTSFSD